MEVILGRARTGPQGVLPGAARTGDYFPFTTQCPLNNHRSGRSGPEVRRFAPFTATAPNRSRTKAAKASKRERSPSTPLLSRLLLIGCLFLETTDGAAVGAVDVARQGDTATEVEVEVVREVVIGRTGPPGAAVTDIAEVAIAAVQKTRSRIPDGADTAELAGEVHTSICGVPGVGEGTAGVYCLRPYAVTAAIGDTPTRRAGVKNGLAGLPTGIVRTGTT